MTRFVVLLETLFLMLAPLLVLAQQTNIQVSVSRAVPRAVLEQQGSTVTVELNADAYTLTPTGDIDTWSVTYPAGANQQAFLYTAEVFVMPVAGVTMTLPDEWVDYGCERPLTLGTDPAWIVMQSLPDGRIACSTVTP